MRALVPIATGSEDIEVIAITDALARGGIEVVLASIESSLLVRLMKGIQIQTSFELAHIAEEHFDEIVVPGHRVVASQAPGTAIEFALSVVRMLRGPRVASEIETYLMISQPHIQK